MPGVPLPLVVVAVPEDELPDPLVVPSLEEVVFPLAPVEAVVVTEVLAAAPSPVVEVLAVEVPTVPVELAADASPVEEPFEVLVVEAPVFTPSVLEVEAVVAALELAPRVVAAPFPAPVELSVSWVSLLLLKQPPSASMNITMRVLIRARKGTSLRRAVARRYHRRSRAIRVDQSSRCHA